MSDLNSEVDTDPEVPREALGVGRLFAESLSILCKKLHYVIPLAFVPGLLSLGVVSSTVGLEAAIGLVEPAPETTGLTLLYYLSLMLEFVIGSVTAALLVQLAYDAKLNRKMNLGGYISSALATLWPVCAVSIGISLLAGIAALAFLLPALWVYAVFFVAVPAVVIERIGFKGMDRSQQLTKEYRWPIMGLIILAIAVAILVMLPGFFVIEYASFEIGLFGSAFLYVVFTVIPTGFFSIVSALVYARLREIKEGVSVDQIAAVFE